MVRPLTELRPSRILVRAPNWVGDLAMATAALRCIRQNFPDAHITVLVHSWLREVLENSPRFDELILYDPKCQHVHWRGYWSFVSALRRRQFDLAMVLPHSFRSAWMAWLSGARRRVGYDRGDRGWLLTDSIRPPREGQRWQPVPKTLYYLDLCRAAGLRVDSTALELFVGDADRRAAKQILADNNIQPDHRLVLINPGASFGSSKCWPPDRFARVADLLAQRNDVRVGLVCGPGEEPIVEAILSHAERGHANLAKKFLPLGTLKALVQRCDLLVTNDTGPRHFAVALDKPVVVIMGSTDPRYSACNLEKTIVLRKDVPCGPCHKRVCPSDHVCMKSISVQEVVATAERLIHVHWNEQ